MRAVGVAVAVALVALGGAACGDEGAGPAAAEAAEVGLARLSLRTLVAGVDGGGWSVGSGPGGEVGLYRLTADDGATLVLALDRGAGTIALGDSIVLGQVACTDEACESKALSVMFVGPDGAATDWRVIDTAPGSPNDADAPTFVGTAGGLLWIYGLDGHLLALDERGEQVGDDVPVESSELCIIDDELFSLGLTDPPVLTPGVPVTVPAAPHAHEVARWDGSSFTPVPGGLLDAETSPGILSYCAHGGFDVDGPSSRASWRPASGWVVGDPTVPPADAISTASRSRSGRSYAVDGTGKLLVLADTGPIDTGLTFAMERGDGPPVVLGVDDSRGHLVACLGKPGDFECQFGTTGAW